MSSIVNKIKEAVHSDSHSNTSQAEGTHGPHSTRTANAADPRIDSDRDHRAAPGGTLGGHSSGAYAAGDNYTHGTGATGTHAHTGTTGTHAHTGTTGTHAHTGTTGGAYGSGPGPAPNTAGPHKSDVLNKVDPRVDSDMDGGRNTGARGATGTHAHTGTTGTHAHTGTTGGFGSSTTTGYNDPEGVHGPHGSRVANAADPRVDSDRDHRGAHHHAGTTAGLAGATAGAGVAGAHPHGHTGTTGTTGAYGTTGGYGNTATGYNDPEGTHGPHGSRIANAADPRVDSDRDHRGAHHGTTGGLTGAGVGATGAHNTHGHTGTTGGLTGGNVATTTTGYNDPEGTHGPHGSRTANAMDPRVDSDRDHRGAHHGTTAGTGGVTGTRGTVAGAPGPAPNTAGPHKSDMLNKVDPRVDSDLDGSKTVGGNKTYQSGSTMHKDPTDAAQVPPSVLAKHVGGPTIEHEDHSHDRARRNSQATHQENFSGI